MPAYYLAFYMYGTLISEPKDRATRIAIFDGTEMAAQVLSIIRQNY